MLFKNGSQIKFSRLFVFLNELPCVLLHDSSLCQRERQTEREPEREKER